MLQCEQFIVISVRLITIVITSIYTNNELPNITYMTIRIAKTYSTLIEFNRSNAI